MPNGTSSLSRRHGRVHKGHTHGDIACIFRANEYPVYEEEIYDPDNYTVAKDPLGLKKDALRERIRC